MSAGMIKMPIAGHIKLNPRIKLLLIGGNAEQLADLKTVISPLAKAGKDGRSGQYLKFCKALLKTLSES